MKISGHHRNVAVVGLGSSGKTVLLTSLIDNIRYHDSTRMNIEPLPVNRLIKKFVQKPDSVKLTNFRQNSSMNISQNLRHSSSLSSQFRSISGGLPDSLPESRAEAMQNDIPLFQYQRNRALLVSGKWPPKTGEMYASAFSFYRSDRKLPYYINVLDFPGERMTDAGMYRKNFREWGQYALTSLEAAHHQAVARKILP